MLTGDGGALTLYGVPAGRITEWTMAPAGGVRLEVTGQFAAYWVRLGIPERNEIRVRLQRTQNPDYDLTFCGDVAELTTARLVLHRCTECSNVS